MRISSLIVAMLLISSCTDLVNDALPTHYDDTIEVVASGSGESYGPELFPWDVENEWLYYSQDTHLIVRPTDDTVQTNGRTSTVARHIGRDIDIQRFIRVTDNAVRDYGNQFKWWPCSMPLLHFPIKVGKKWRVGDPYGDMRAEATVESVEVVETAMGAFESVKVHYFSRNAEGQEQMHSWVWFAPGIGMVRWKHLTGWGSHASPSADDWLLRSFTVDGYDTERAAARAFPSPDA